MATNKIVVPAIANIDVIKIPMLIKQSLVQIGKAIGLARWKLCFKVFADIPDFVICRKGNPA